MFRKTEKFEKKKSMVMALQILALYYLVVTTIAKVREMLKILQT